MIDMTLNQPLLASPSSRRGAIAPGLLRVLQQAVAIRLVLAVLALGVFGAVASGWIPAQQMAWVPVLLVIEAAAYLGFVTWSRVRDVLGRWFLPAALGWFLLAPIVEQALLFTSLPPVALDRLGSNGLPGVGIEAILLVVPVILATWQYGRRGWIASLGVLAIGHLALAVLIGQDAMQVGVYVVAAAGRLAMIALLGYVVMQLVGRAARGTRRTVDGQSAPGPARGHGRAASRKPGAQPAGARAARHPRPFADRPERATPGRRNVDELRPAGSCRTVEGSPGHCAQRYPGVRGGRSSRCEPLRWKTWDCPKRCASFAGVRPSGWTSPWIATLPTSRRSIR